MAYCTYKLKSINTPSYLFNIFNSFLLNRYVSVKINENTFDFIAISADVPQGSKLGPLLCTKIIGFCLLKSSMLCRFLIRYYKFKDIVLILMSYFDTPMVYNNIFKQSNS